MTGGRPGCSVTPGVHLDRISIELTNRCQKGCWFCYNHSGPQGGTQWQVDEVLALVRDCHRHGVQAVSFGGGEPLLYDGWREVLTELDGHLFRSLTTNGQLLERAWDDVLAARPDKIHISIHFPEDPDEVRTAGARVMRLERAGIRSGVNLLVARSRLGAASVAAATLHAMGIGNDRIVYLPMRGEDTPSANEVSRVARNRAFQSMSCLSGCEKSDRFCSIGWDQTVAWCSYTASRKKLAELSYAGLCAALVPLPLVFCGGTDNE